MDLEGSELPVCPNCRHLLLQVGNSCQFCGHVVKESRRQTSNARIRLPRVPEERRRFGGSLARFIQSLRRRSGRRLRSGDCNSDDEDYFQEDVSSSSGSLRKCRSVTSLPPITTPSEGGHIGGYTGIIKVRPFRPPSNDSETKEEHLHINNAKELKEAMEKTQKSGDHEALAYFYVSTFDSFHDMNLVFRRRTPGDRNDCELDLEFVEAAFQYLMQLPTDVQKSVLKAVINCLLSDQRNSDVVLMKSVCRDDLRAYMILLQNPQFQKPSTYVVYAHLLRQVATLCDTDHQLLAEWMTNLSTGQMLAVLSSIQQFIGIRLFPPKPQDLPPMSKCSWWIPCAVKNLAILNAANDVAKSISFTEFYNGALDHWDLMSDFLQWQTPTINAGFSFCQYPFILSINAKKTILEGHAEQQMIATARDSIIGTLAIRRTPDMDMLFLNITVRRHNLLEDSLRELSKKHDSLRKKLRVQFAGEPGLDMGGLTKEWFQLLVRKIFHPDYGMFVYNTGSEVYWFSTVENEVDEVLQEYHLVGVLMGLAVYNGVILDIRLPQCCYKKLLSPAVVPRILDVHSTPLGITQLNLDDLAQIVPVTTKGLRDLLTYDGNVEEDFGLNFQISLEEFGVVRTVDLKQNGSEIPVTNDNREEYVRMYVEWYLNQAVCRQFKAFYLGFHSVCSTNLLLLLRPEEIELLVCGSVSFDMEQLRQVTVYDGYPADSKTIRYFWDLVLKLPERHQKRLLLFVTGTDRVPVGGMKEMTLKISRMVSSNPDTALDQMLPMAHTCFNQLILPDYQNRSLLRQKLAIALAHGEGFGLE